MTPEERGNLALKNFERMFPYSPARRAELHEAITSQVREAEAALREFGPCGEHPMACMVVTKVLASQGEPGEVCGQARCSACEREEKLRDLIRHLTDYIVAESVTSASHDPERIGERNA